MIDNGKLVQRIERHLSETGQSASAFGYLCLGDPGFLRKLKAGRVPREKTKLRILSYLLKDEKNVD
jgi:hypothetical protein